MLGITPFSVLFFSPPPLLFYFGATTGDVEALLLVQHLGISTGGAWRTIWMPRIGPGLTVYKANTLLP